MGPVDKLKRLRREQILKVGLVGGAFLLVLLAMLAYSRYRLRAKVVSKAPAIHVTDEARLPEESWMAKSAGEIDDLKQERQQLKERMEGLEKAMGELGKPGAGEALPPLPPPPPPLPEPPADYPSSEAPAPRPEMQPGIQVIVPETVPTALSKGASQTKAESGAWMPSGSFMQGTLLTGIDAPTGTSAVKNTIPVLIRITRPAVLPNRFRAETKECFVVGEAYGDLSAERAYVRTTYLSCLDADGKKVVDLKLKGFVADEDGKVGIHGQVVSKQGALLGRTLLAGFLKGMSEAMNASSYTYSTSALGTTQTVKPSEVLQAGALNGASTAAEKLADFYMNMANQMFPVVEVPAGRRLDLVVTQGMRLTEIEREE
ncbi:MAG: TraB/VirB10 family protein [Pseudomonadota bacterium]